MNPQLVYLVQTETTVGFLSQNREKLSTSKQRNKNQPFITCVDSFTMLKKFTRVPKRFKNIVRRSKKTTFIYPKGKAFRVINDSIHLKFIKKLKWAYSSSANLTLKKFEENCAKQKADIIVENSRGFFESTPSSIIMINSKKARRLR
ncbi:MAG: Sua5 YciO YrdC YwlC family protein [Sulfurospirillum sp.]|nr:Sua5 YciO YrdC YwlC family protein [Sulfurospirillum sp.]